jgi:hypothetical protein
MIGALGEIVEWMLVAVAGWRYLLSPKYRKAKNDDWKYEKAIYVVWDVCGGLAGIGFSILVVWLILRELIH